MATAPDRENVFCRFGMLAVWRGVVRNICAATAAHCHAINNLFIPHTHTYARMYITYLSYVRVHATKVFSFCLRLRTSSCVVDVFDVGVVGIVVVVVVVLVVLLGTLRTTLPR